MEERNIAQLKFIRWLAIPMFVIGFILLSSAWEEYQIVREFDIQGVRVEASIVDHERESKNSHLVTYHYEVDGLSYTTEDERINLYGVYKSLGNKTDIYYLPDDPSKSLIVNNRLNYRGSFEGALIIFGLFGVAAQILPIYNHKRNALLARLTIHSRMIFATLLFLSVIVTGLPIFSRPNTIWINLCFGIPMLIALGVLLLVVSLLHDHHTELNEAIDGQITDITQKRVPMPKGRFHFAENLMEMGFQRMGEISRLESEYDESTVTWIYRNADHTILAEMYYDIELMQFSTWFGEGFRVETGFPIGEQIRTKQFIASFTEKGIKDAYQLHISKIDGVQKDTGLLPTPVPNLEAYMRREDYYMRHFYRRSIRRLTNVNRLRVVFGIYLVTFFAAMIYAYYDFPEHELWEFLIAGTVVGYLFNALPGWLLNYCRYPIQFIHAEAKEAKESAQHSDEEFSEPESLEEIYNETEFTANRKGLLTDEQIKTLRLISGVDMFPMLLFIIGYIGIGFFALLTFVALGDSDLVDSQKNAWVMLAFCGFVAVVNTFFFWRALQKRQTFKQRLTSERVLSLQNIVKHDFIRREYSDSVGDYWYEYVHDPLIQIVDQYAMMEDDASYNIYYWSHVFDEDEYEDYQWVLSIEKSSD